MPDQTAHDAVRDALDRDVPYLGSGGREQRVENVLAALGIPPDTTTDEVRAGLFMLHREGTGHKQIGRDVFRASHVDFHGRITGALGTSAAAAVLALAAKLDVDPESRACAEFYADLAPEADHA